MPSQVWLREDSPDTVVRFSNDGGTSWVERTTGEAEYLGGPVRSFDLPFAPGELVESQQWDGNAGWTASQDTLTYPSPVPEPSSISMLLVGAVLVSRMQIWRGSKNGISNR